MSLRPGGRLILVDHVRSTFLPIYWLQWLYEFVPKRTKGEYMTRRPAEHVEAQGLEIVERDRLRAGVVERLVAVMGRGSRAYALRGLAGIDGGEYRLLITS